MEEPGWLQRPEMLRAARFTLTPKQGSNLPVMSVDLTPLEDGLVRRLIYFSRVFGTIAGGANDAATDLFRLYGLGWSATWTAKYQDAKGNRESRNIRSIAWIYPSGSVVLGAEDPPYVEDLLRIYRSNLRGQA